MPKTADAPEIAELAFNCLGGIMAAIVPIGFLFWLHEQNEAAAASQKEIAKKAEVVMTVEKLPQQFRFEHPTFSIGSQPQGQALIENTNDGTFYYFEKKPVAKLEGIKKRMNDFKTQRDEFTVKKRGTLPVGGKTFEYVRGISKRESGAIFNELRGYILASDASVVEVATGTPDAGEVDMDSTKELFGAIKSFTP
jgi:hypothetical protein